MLFTISQTCDSIKVKKMSQTCLFTFGNQFNLVISLYDLQNNWEAQRAEEEPRPPQEDQQDEAVEEEPESRTDAAEMTERREDPESSRGETPETAPTGK